MVTNRSENIGEEVKLRDGEDPVTIGQTIINKEYELQLDPQLVFDVIHYNINHPANIRLIERATVIGRTGKESRQGIPWTEEEDSLLIQTRRMLDLKNNDQLNR